MGEEIVVIRPESALFAGAGVCIPPKPTNPSWSGSHSRPCEPFLIHHFANLRLHSTLELSASGALEVAEDFNQYRRARGADRLRTTGPCPCAGRCTVSDVLPARSWTRMPITATTSRPSLRPGVATMANWTLRGGVRHDLVRLGDASIGARGACILAIVISCRCEEFCGLAISQAAIAAIRHPVRFPAPISDPGCRKVRPPPKQPHAT